MCIYNLGMHKEISISSIESRILLIRGQKVMLDADLAVLYQVKTHQLNEAVKRNSKRFPDDFMFRLTKDEKTKVIAICDNLKPLKYSSHLPYAFTEQGVSMLSSILKTERAIEVNIAIMRTFVQLRRLASTHKDLSFKLAELERKSIQHDESIESIFETLRRMLVTEEKPKRRMGFHTD